MKALIALLLAATPVAAQEYIIGDAKVIDGRTIEVSGTTVRLIGVDTGPDTQERLEWYLRGMHIYCDLFGGTITDFDREIPLGTCYVGGHGMPGRDIALMLIYFGFALDCPRYSGGRYTQFEQPVDIPRSARCQPDPFIARSGPLRRTDIK